MIRISLLLGFLLIVALVKGQFLYSIPNSENIVVRNLETADGLSNNYIYSICQDSHGFIWLGSLNGLNKFDGHQFRNYYFDQDDSSTLSSNTIRQISLSKDNDILVCTSAGLDVFSTKTGKIKRLTSIIYPPFTKISTYASATDSKGNIWLGSWYNILFYIQKNTGKVEHFKLEDHGLSETINTLFIDKQDNVWIGTRGAGLFEYDQKSNKFKQYFYQGLKENNFKDNYINGIRQIEKDQLILCTFNGLKRFGLHTQQFSDISVYTTKGKNLLKDRKCNDLVKDARNIIWVATDSGLVVLDEKFQHGKNILPDDNNKQGLVSGNIQTLFVDNKNNIWIGSQTGVAIFDYYMNQFHFSPIYSKKEGALESLSLATLQEGSDGSIWAILDHDYMQLYPDGKTNMVAPQKLLSSVFNELKWKDKQNSIFVNALNNCGLYFQYRGVGPFTLLKNAPFDSTSLSENLVFKIFKDSNYNLWFLTEKKGLSRYISETKNFRNYSCNPTDSSTINNNYLFNILEDSKHQLWIATWDGLAKYNREKDCFQRFITSKLVFSILDTKDGYFWLGTSNGLVRFNPLTGKETIHLTVRQGLPDNSVYGLLMDNHKNLWISTSKGLSKIKISDFSIVNFNRTDGLMDDEFMRVGALKAANGRFYFLGRHGITYFHPDSISSDPNSTAVAITSVQVYNTPLFDKKITESIIDIFNSPTIVLNSGQNNLSIQFSALNFIHPEKCSYRFRLEPFEKGWNEVVDQQVAKYTNLPPGKYIFRIYASNNQGLWSKEETALNLELLPPFWKTWWFRILVVIILISALYLGYAIKVRLIQKRQRELELLIEKRTQELMDRNQQIDKQTKELEIYSNTLEKNNELLIEKQKFIENQAQVLKESNEKLLVLISTKDKFFSIIAHDLKNPFNVISGFSELLLNNHTKYPVEKVQRFLRHIFNTSKNTNSLLENLLYWSRSQTGSITYEPGIINLALCMEETLKFFEADIHKKNLQFVTALNPEIVVFADENMLKTILRNLISNAIKFTYEGGKITLESRMENQMVYTLISDTGMGISTENQQLLFHIGTNYSSAGTGKESGTGLGLILCKEFVEKNYGKIWVESEEGKGSTFGFTLPSKPMKATSNLLKNQNNV